MIEVVQGCLVKALGTHVGAIAHQCNCFCSFGKGLALTIKKQYPEAYKVDRTTAYGDKSKLGSFTKASVPGRGVVYNLYGQYKYNSKQQQTHYKSLENALLLACEDCRRLGITSLGLPYGIGCGLGGGDWGVVSGIISKAQDKIQEVKIYTFKV